MPTAFIQVITLSTCKKLTLCEVVREMVNGGWWEEWLVHVHSLYCFLQEVGLIMSGNYIAMTQDIHFARVLKVTEAKKQKSIQCLYFKWLLPKPLISLFCDIS